MNSGDTETHVIASGNKVILRDGLPSDAEAYVQWWTRGEWLDYDAPWEVARKPFDKEKRKQTFLESFIEDIQSPRSRAIIATTDGKPIGWVNQYGEKRFPNSCSVGIDICEDDYLNRGMGDETLRLWVEYLFLNSNVHRIALAAYSFNKRMIRVAEKVGFTFEGADREIIQWQNEWIDRVHFGILRREWEQTNDHTTEK